MGLVWNGTMFVNDSSSSQGTTMSVSNSNDFLLKANNLSDIPNRNTARENLGITISLMAPVTPKINDLWVDLDS